MPGANEWLPQHTIMEWITLDAVRLEPLRQAAAYWNRQRGKRPWPSREELKLRDMAGFASHLSLVRVIDDGADFEHRIVGDVMVRAFSVPIQNRRFSEIAVEAPELIEKSSRAFKRVLETRAPFALRQQTGHERLSVRFVEAEMIFLPLGRSAEVIDHIAVFGCHG